MPLHSLPSELLYSIWLHLDCIQDRNSFVRVSRQTYSEYNPYLYHYAARHSPASIAHWAGEHGYQNILQWLVTQRPNVLNNRATTPLFAAAEHNQEGVLRLLIHNKVDLESRNSEGKIALHIAAQEGHESVVRLLVKAGVNLDQVYMDETALTAAARNGHDNVVLFLLDQGASATVRDSIERPALGYAVEKCSLAVTERLVPLTPTELLNREDDWGYTPLTIAAEQGNKPAAELLLAAGASVLEGGRDSTALRVAIQHEQTEMVRLLLDSGAQVNDSPEQYPPLPLAAQLGCDEIVRLLLERGADPNYILPWHRPTLHCAASGGHYGIVKQLLDAGALPDPDDDRSERPLLSALSQGHDDTAALLIERGAHTDWDYDPSDLTTLIWAVRNGNEDLTKQLIEEDHDLDDGDQVGRAPLVVATLNGRRGCLELLLGAGANAEARDDKGRAPLAIAAERGWVDIAVALLQYRTHGGSTPTSPPSGEQRKSSLPAIDTPDQLNRTALFYATVNGHVEIVAALLAHGSTAIDRPTCAGRTPRSIVAQWLRSKDLPTQCPVAAIAGLFDDGAPVAVSSAQEQQSESPLLEPRQAFSDHPWDLYYPRGMSCERCSTPIKQYVERFVCDICYKHWYHVCPECVVSLGSEQKCLVVGHKLRRVVGG
ncbi:ankyrin repeat-containing domain protein [Aspergillus aurantiobrunneus]